MGLATLQSVDQVITLSDVNLMGESTNTQVIHDLLRQGKLITG
jgi:hypothetical protein